MNDLEHQLRTALTEIAAHDTPTPDLAERLIANARSGTNTVVPFRRSARFTAPLLAAAVVLLLAAGILVATRFSTTSPPVSPPPAPSSPSSSAPSSVTGSADPRAVPGWISGSVGAAAGLPVGFGPLSSQFLDGTTGFLLGSGPCTTGPDQCGGLFRTQDGGATWTELPALTDAAGGTSGGVSCPVGAADTGTCVLSVRFSDALHGIASGGRTPLVTVDGGTSWSRITGTTDEVRPVAQLGEVAFALDFDLTTGEARLLRATGDRFVAVTGPGTPSTPRYLMAGAGRLFVVSTSTDGADSLASTTDGTTWRAEPAPPCASAAFEVRADGTVVLTCLTEPRGALLTDGARSWTEFGGAPVSVTGAESFARITAVTDSRHFAVLVERGGLDSGSRYVWGVTSDGGKTWRTIESETRFPSPEDASRLLSGGGAVLTAALTTERLLVASTDLGLTWTARAVR